MSEHEWYPADWVDESCPPAKARPEDFVHAEGDGWRLGYAKDDNSILDEDRAYLQRPLKPGDVVEFMHCERLGDVQAWLRRDGNYQLNGAVPPGHNSVMVDGDVDTLHESFDALIAALTNIGDWANLPELIFDNGEDQVCVTLSFADWSDPLPHLFEIENGQPVFRPVPPAAEKN